MSSPLSIPITIRPAYADDDLAVARLAALDSALIPAGPLVLAEVDGEVRVALSLSDQSVIADPFHRTLELVELLRDHAEPERRRQTRSARGRRSSTMLRRGLLRTA